MYCLTNTDPYAEGVNRNTPSGTEVPLYSGHGTVGRGMGRNEPNVNYDPHPILPPWTEAEYQASRQSLASLPLKLDTNAPNPFYLRPEPKITWSENYLILRDPALRTRAYQTPLDRGMAESSLVRGSTHLQSCYAPRHLQYYHHQTKVPKAGYPH